MQVTEIQSSDLVHALDEEKPRAGILEKCGSTVRACVRRALAGSDLAGLRAAVEREFRTLDEAARSQRAVLAKLESGFVSRLAALRHD